MECPLDNDRNEDLLVDYCADRLAPRIKIALESHIALCSACSAWVGEQRAVWTALDQWQAAPISPGFDRQIYERIACEESRLPWWQALTKSFCAGSSPASLRPALSLALASLLVLAALLLERPGSSTLPLTVASHSESLDADRLERALDDVDMLRQLSVTENPDSQKSM